MHAKTKKTEHAKPAQRELCEQAPQQQTRKKAAYQSNAAGVASVRSSASPGRLLSPRPGQDSVGNFVIVGRAAEKRGRRG